MMCPFPLEIPAAPTLRSPPSGPISTSSGRYNHAHTSFMPEYRPQELDRKWQQRWAASRAFEVSADPSRQKFYCARDVRVPVRTRAHRATSGTTSIGDVMARTKRMRGYNVLLPLRVGRLRVARRERRDQRRDPSGSLHARQHHAHEGTAAAAWDQLRVGARAGDVRSRVLQVEPMALHPDVRARPGVPPALVGQLVPELQHGSGQRAGGRRRLLALRHTGRDARPPAMVLPYYRIRRRAAGCCLWPDRLAREGADDAAELDRAIGRGARALPDGGGSRVGVHRGVHDTHRHDLRRDLRVARSRAPAGHRPGGPVEGPCRRSVSRCRRFVPRTVSRG